ncbi:MAG: TIGR03016 family PEP-CTERM system-associated outer membrane protein [Pseudomonadota bacterium]
MTLVAAAAHAQVWTREAAVSTRAELTDNSRPGTGTTVPKEADLVLTVEPSLRVAGVGPRLNLRMDASAGVVGSARGTVPTEVLPSVDAVVGAALVPRLLFLDASATVRQAESNPFGVRVSDVVSENRHTTSEYRVAPLLRWRFAPRAELLARHEEDFVVNTTAARGGDTSTDIHRQTSVLRLDRDPVPLGGGIELGRDDARTTGAVLNTRTTIESGRAQLSYAFDSIDVVLGMIGGRERGTSDVLRFSENLYGVALRWSPSTRTDVTARAEHRFFGTGGRLNIRLRTPQAAFVLRAFREPTTATSAFSRVDTAADAALLASSLAARSAPLPNVPTAVGAMPEVPLEGEEGALEQQAPRSPFAPPRSVGEELLGRRGFPMELPGVIDIASGYPQVESTLDVRWVLIGRRHSVTTNLYTRLLKQITQGSVGPLPPTDDDSRQVGGALTVTRRLDPTTSLDFSLTGSRVTGLGTLAGTRTDEGAVALTMVRQLSPSTTFTTGVRYVRLRTNVASVLSFEASTLLVGLSHRF